MPVLVFGDTSSENYAAAFELRPALEELLESPQNEARIVASASTIGCGTEDIDLLVMGVCRQPVVIPPALLPAELRIRPCRLSNFALVIEIKSHDASAVRFEGNQVFVKYRDHVTGRTEEKCATDQNIKQVHSLRTYIRRNHLDSPYFLRAIWLRGVPSGQLPSATHQFLGSRVTKTDLLRLMVDQQAERLIQNLAKPWKSSYLSCCRDDSAAELIAAMDLFTRKLEATPLDRKKIERITKQTFTDEVPKYIERLGHQLLVFSGRGGSGKTVRILQLAFWLRQDRGSRILLLTYNRALAADLRRLLILMGIRDKLDEPTVSIKTSEKFFWDVMSAWGMAPSIEDGAAFPDAEFQLKKAEFRDLIKGESAESLRGESAWRSNPSLFDWNFVMVDEAQDWPTEERDIVASLFGAKSLIVADGVDQLVRRDGRCDWASLAPPAERWIQPLRKALRLKANLCRFIEAFVEVAGLEWDLKVNDEVPGGRVILILRDYTRDVHERIMENHLQSGNKPLDALFCVTAGGSAPGGQIASSLQNWGAKVWDGTSESERDTYPHEVDQYRIVKYESCRGLEGWTVVCLDFDRFLQRQYMDGMARPRDLYETQEDVAKRYSARWGMIPMTRAIDTLVIQVSETSRTAADLERLSEGRAYVEVIRR